MIFGDALHTPRLSLRRLRETDLSLFIEWSNSERANGDYLTPECLDLECVREQIRSGILWSDDNRVFLVEIKNGPSIGTVHYWRRSESKKNIFMALKISEPDQRNRGYGSEAQKYVIINLFQRLKVESVEMYTDINNLPQQRCLQKLGFELVETLNYMDRQVCRVGHLYRLDAAKYAKSLVYQYHYA